jgi:uncharacterized protein
VYNFFMALRSLEQIEPALRSLLEQRPEILVGYLFGSVVCGRARPDSDVDIAVLVADEVMADDSFRYRLNRISDLMSVLKRDDVDFVLLNEAPPLLAHRILRYGKLVFERSPSARVAFQVRTMNRYSDTQPMRHLYLSYLKKHAQEGSIFGR